MLWGDTHTHTQWNRLQHYDHIWAQWWFQWGEEEWGAGWMIWNQNCFHLNGASIIFKKDEGLLEHFSAFQLSFPACTSLLRLLSGYLIPQREFIHHSKGNEALPSQRKWSIHISWLNVYKIGTAESQSEDLQETKETPQEQRQQKGGQDIFQGAVYLAL